MSTTLEFTVFSKCSYASLTDAKTSGGDYSIKLTDCDSKTFNEGAPALALQAAACAMNCLDGGFSAVFCLIDSNDKVIDIVEYRKGDRLDSLTENDRAFLTAYLQNIEVGDYESVMRILLAWRRKESVVDTPGLSDIYSNVRDAMTMWCAGRDHATDHETHKLAIPG